MSKPKSAEDIAVARWAAVMQLPEYSGAEKLALLLYEKGDSVAEIKTMLKLAHGPGKSYSPAPEPDYAAMRMSLGGTRSSASAQEVKAGWRKAAAAVNARNGR